MNILKSYLDKGDEFCKRHIGIDDDDIKYMLSIIGVGSKKELIDRVVPNSIKTKNTLNLPPAISEFEALRELKKIATQNKIYKNYIGCGYYSTITPPVIIRNLLENAGWYTAYTPYQPEISQGRLEALLNYQQMVMDLTAMEIANASLLDEATAAAEAMLMAKRVTKQKKSNIFVVASDIFPQTFAVLKTRAESLGFELKAKDPNNAEFWELAKDAFGILLQYPNNFGEIYDYQDKIKTISKSGTIITIATDLMASILLKPAGEMGADIAFGSAQRFGVPLGFGGPHAAFFATREKFKRSVPGRIVGVSVDKDDKIAYRLALQTREQHIRREKATSNICTSQVLLANIAGFYAIWHGQEGLKAIAKKIASLTSILVHNLKKYGFNIINSYIFDTVVIDLGSKKVADELLKKAQNFAVNFRDLQNGQIGISIGEQDSLSDIEAILKIFKNNISLDTDAPSDMLPKNLVRKSSFLTHSVFNKYKTEVEMMRYLRKLEQKDISLNRSMIALGSCTMKLNAAAEMLPITWPEFTEIHPFAPKEQWLGYKKLIDDLEKMLATITGFAAVSMQPNAGSQGEYAGLLVIKKYHEKKGEAGRNICLIPSSAHGTNPASAVMAGLRVVVVRCDENGNIDIKDLKQKAEEYKNSLAALMVTYPSTHGVFEEAIVEICDTVHQNGGQVYMDGANLNALVGLAKPAEFGADVAHLNLHKTFAIPHGGGGPGVGPIAVKEHLAEFLPSHDLVQGVGGKYAISAVSASPFGSAAILPITWMYIRMMGADGLKMATEAAIISANYLAKKLSKYYDILYKGKDGLVAHECIIDTRHFLNNVGISVEDIAKRLMDFGFHAPTISFPVPHTLMIEPTESESLEEINRFIEAMGKIREEIANVEKSIWAKDNNPLVNAPHNIEDILKDNWNRPYSKEEAIFPANYVRENKYWPPVGRINSAAGDRNFICSCPDMGEYTNSDKNVA